MTASTILAVSGSNPTGEAPFSACLEIAGERHAASSPAGRRGDLATTARELLRSHGIAPAQLDELRVDLGPGSYTGLRVAITFVRVLQHFGRVAVQACDTLALLADTAPADSGRRRPLLDARRGRFHCGTLTEQGGRLQHLAPPRALPFDEVLASITPGDTFVVAPNLDEEIAAGLRERAAVHVATAVTAERLFSSRLPLAHCTTAELEPRYLMGSYAE